MPRPPQSECAACGPEQADHLALWIGNTSDILLLAGGNPKRMGVLRFFARLGEGALWLLSRLFFYLGRAVGAVTLLNDPEKALSRRSRLLWEEARRRGITLQQLSFFGKPTDTFWIQIDGKRRFFQSVPFPPGLEQYSTAMDDKVAFKKKMRENGLPVPASRSVRSLSRAQQALTAFGAVCVKPQSGSNGRHTYPYVRTEEELSEALASVKEICFLASIEEHLEGNLCRATCVNGKLIGFLESMYPTVTGDGKARVLELVERANAEKPAGVEDIVLTSSHEGYIRRRGYSLNDVVPAGVTIPLTYRAGWGQGGRNKEHGRAIHPSFIPVIEKAAALTELPIVGFDLIIPDALASADAQRWGFIEANSLPWIDLHSQALEGPSIDLSPAVWDLWVRP